MTQSATAALPAAEGRLANIHPGKLLMWAFLGSDVMGFAGLIAGYFYLRYFAVDWPSNWEMLNLPLTMVNTVILLSSSYTMVRAHRHIEQGNQSGLLRQLGLTIALGTAFLLIQLYEYEELIGVFAETFDGRPFTGHVFATTFFTLTGFHGAHVLVGLIYLACIFVAAWRGRYGAQNFVAVDIAALFWHFVDWVWVAVFTSVYLI